MVAIPRQPESLVESLFSARAERLERRNARLRAAGKPVPVGPGVLVRVALVLADVMGTLVMCSAITVGAFLLVTWAGFVVGGLMVPLFEFKVMYRAKKISKKIAADRAAAEQAAER